MCIDRVAEVRQDEIARCLSAWRQK